MPKHFTAGYHPNTRKTGPCWGTPVGFAGTCLTIVANGSKCKAGRLAIIAAPIPRGGLAMAARLAAELGGILDRMAQESLPLESALPPVGQQSGDRFGVVVV